MIDEKKLIEDLLHNDGMHFTVNLQAFTAEGLCNCFQEFTDKMKQGFADLINAQPRIEFKSVEEGYPTEAREYLCRCNIDGNDEFPFYMVLRYYLVDETPHFQHETVHGLHVTHWMAFEPPKVGGGACRKRISSPVKRCICFPFGSWPLIILGLKNRSLKPRCFPLVGNT